jgi:hypothetical protein
MDMGLDGYKKELLSTLLTQSLYVTSIIKCLCLMASRLLACEKKEGIITLGDRHNFTDLWICIGK